MSVFGGGSKQLSQEPRDPEREAVDERLTRAAAFDPTGGVRAAFGRLMGRSDAAGSYTAGAYRRSLGGHNIATMA